MRIRPLVVFALVVAGSASASYDFSHGNDVAKKKCTNEQKEHHIKTLSECFSGEAAGKEKEIFQKRKGTASEKATKLQEKAVANVKLGKYRLSEVENEEAACPRFFQSDSYTSADREYKSAEKAQIDADAAKIAAGEAWHAVQDEEIKSSKTCVDKADEALYNKCLLNEAQQEKEDLEKNLHEHKKYINVLVDQVEQLRKLAGNSVPKQGKCPKGWYEFKNAIGAAKGQFVKFEKGCGHVGPSSYCTSHENIPQSKLVPLTTINGKSMAECVEGKGKSWVMQYNTNTKECQLANTGEYNLDGAAAPGVVSCWK